MAFAFASKSGLGSGLVSGSRRWVWGLLGLGLWFGVCGLGSGSSAFGQDADEGEVEVEVEAGVEEGEAGAKAKTDEGETDGGTETDADTAGRPGPGRRAYLDEYLEAAWKEEGIAPSERATDAEFLRRAYLDLLGHIPTPAEARAFLGNKDPGKREKLIETLLDHPDFARNMAIVWRIVLVGRNDGGGGNQNVDSRALETWLRRQFGRNRPWDEMARELIAGEGSNKENGAVNYVLAHMGDDAVNLTSNTTRIFLGQQIQCTQCHDHPSNDWKQKHFWGVNGFFKAASSETVRTTNATGLSVVDHVRVFDREVEAEDLYASYDRRDGLVMSTPATFLDGRRLELSEGTTPRAELARFVTERDNLNFAMAFANRMWAHFLGRGIVHPVDDFGDHNPPSLPEALEELATDFRDNGYNVKDLIRWITKSRAYHLSSRRSKSNDLDETLFSRMYLKPMTPEQLYESLLVATQADRVDSEESSRRRERFARQFISTFGNDDGGELISFQGTIPQALLMMNGELTAAATSNRPGSFLRKTFEEARASRDASGYVITQIYLAALSRPPSSSELRAFQGQMARDRYPEQVAEDLFWALLNSNAFILNH